MEVIDALTTILEQGPATMRQELGDWNLKDVILFFSKRKTTSPMMINYEILPECFMITRQQDTLENLKPTMPYNNTIGGLDYAPMSRTMYAVVAPVSNLKLTDCHLDPPISPLREPIQLDPLGIAPWISSWIYPLQTVLILSWS